MELRKTRPQLKVKNTISMSSVSGLAELMKIGRQKMRGIIANLHGLGLITKQSHNKGTVLKATVKGRQVLEFATVDASDFNTTLKILQDPCSFETLYIINKLQS